MQTNKYRNSYCGTITEKDIDKNLTLSGWIENIRDHGGIIFLDLRDETGTIQLVSNDDGMFQGLTKESTVTVTGTVRKRDKEDYNPNLKTGTIELLVNKIEVLSKSVNVLPFEIKTSNLVSEELRLKYRYLDLRNKRVRNNIQKRAELLKFIRNKMDSLGFLEVQTPIITASSPEGARDFVIPSRKYPGKFYALPQAPQIYKELLMVGGVDKYYQIAPCFRDEDSRADRTMEFYQLDFEMAFVEEEDIYRVGEEIFYDIFTHFSEKEVSPKPFKRICYKEAMLKYGTDKPDLRNPLEIMDITKLFEETTFKPFQKATIRAIKVDDIGTNSNSWFNEIVDYATSIGMPGIGYVTLIEDGSLKGPIDKFSTKEERENLIKETNLKTNSVLFFIANKKEKLATKYAGQIRTYLGNKCNLIDKNKFEFCIINDFPMFEYNEEEKKYDFCHNPFSMPKGGKQAIETEILDNILAYQYDFVCNGYEMSSGALRNYDLECLELAFEKVGYNKEVVKERFKSLYNAFQYGAPPHGGMAPGIDRMVMLLNDVDNLREVQAFPTSASGIDNLMGSPSELTEQQLRELHIKIR
ncbi:MAG: aspartate--tRNA ligase [Erysipelotrichaceae bacterium]|nr:aspartate--tRNA ligase [Erysipelotrichaceae bacterium]